MNPARDFTIKIIPLGDGGTRINVRDGEWPEKRGTIMNGTDVRSDASIPDAIARLFGEYRL